MSWDKLGSLTPFVKAVALQKATEAPFSGRFLQVTQSGTYLCRRCGLALWNTEQQFSSHCGWPSFDDRMTHAISEQKDADGYRIEILCERCQSHLGHVFKGEGFTSKNHRDCVNSVVLDFIPVLNVKDTREIIVAGGCFWGVEHFMQQQAGVVLTECGYIGGHLDFPSYEQVCSGTSGHYEAIRVVYDINQCDLQTLYQLFFEIHDPTQHFGQGPDIGHQYQSAIFYYDDEQKEVALQLINQLTQAGYRVATQLHTISTFWPAETYHQHYYDKHQKQPYCHQRTKRFDSI
jgi:peptide methionine sulfoxide reductase msrA/msrB